MKRWRYLFALSFACCAYHAARATVVYVDVEDMPVFGIGTPVHRYIDLNADGIFDVMLTSSQNDFRATSLEGSLVAGYVSPLPNIGSRALPFAVGEEIGPDGNNDWTWNAGASFLVVVRDTGHTGLWGPGTAYLGLEFEVEGAKHYGWVEIFMPFLINGGYVTAYGYEALPNTAIVAGVIPEPATCAIAFSIVAFSYAIRRRRNA